MGFAISLQGLLILALPTLFSCATRHGSEIPEFLVTSEQVQQLQTIYKEAGQQLGGLSPINTETVTILLKNYDDEIQAVLNAEQWLNYDNFHRSDWARIMATSRRWSGVLTRDDYYPGIQRSSGVKVRGGPTTRRITLPGIHITTTNSGQRP